MNAGDPKILPPNSSPVERAIDAAGAARLDALDVQTRHLWNPATCPRAWLPVLAWALGVETWRSDWPEATKRAVIAATPRIKRLKGTVGAVKTAVQSVSALSPVRIIEWFRPGGSGVPLTAIVDVDVTNGAPAQLPHDAMAAANAAKRESVHLSIRLSARPSMGLRSAALMRRPLISARLRLSGDLRPTLGGEIVNTGLIRRPVIIANLRGTFS